MIVEKEFIPAEDERLATVRVLPNIETPPRILFLHGAGTAHKGLVLPFAQDLARQGVGSIAFDFSGHGESSKHTPSSLSKRVLEATQVIKQMGERSVDAICAFSMGGYVGLHLLHILPVRNLILFGPAVYDQKAFHIPFGPRFQRMIRQKESWRNSDSQELLASFTGRLLIFSGESDNVVPPEIITLILSQAKLAHPKTLVILPKTEHRIARAMNGNEVLRKQITKRVLAFIK